MAGLLHWGRSWSTAVVYDGLRRSLDEVYSETIEDQLHQPARVADQVSGVPVVARRAFAPRFRVPSPRTFARPSESCVQWARATGRTPSAGRAEPT